MPLIFAGCGLAQTLQVYSELAEIDSTGTVTSPENPREILSPMLVRGGFTSFQIVVEVPPGTTYGLHVGQNPENAALVKLYRETGNGQLHEVELPFKADKTTVFWLNIWISPIAPIRRIKIEPQLHIEPQPGREEDWVQYPMEARIVAPTTPEGGDGPAEGWPSAIDHPDVMLRAFLCGTGYDAPELSGPTIALNRARNALADVMIAWGARKDPRVATDLKRMLGSCNGKPFGDLEAYLPIRDYLFRLP